MFYRLQVIIDVIPILISLHRTDFYDRSIWNIVESMRQDRCILLTVSINDRNFLSLIYLQLSSKEHVFNNIFIHRRTQWTKQKHCVIGLE